MRKHKFTKRLLILFFTLVMFISTSSVAINSYAQESKQNVVKVGVIELNGFFEFNEDSSYTGIVYDILNVISMYNSTKYEFVESSIIDNYSMLESGEVDMIIPADKNRIKDLDLDLCISKKPVCDNSPVLLTNYNSGIFYGDYASLENKTIGCVALNSNITMIKDFYLKRNIDINIDDSYKTIFECKKAMEKGKVDAIISRSDRYLSDCQVVQEFDKIQEYAATLQTNSKIMDDFDKAYQKMLDNNPDLLDTLNKKYSNVQENVYPKFTKSEKEYIDKDCEINIGIGSEDMKYINNENSLSFYLIKYLEKVGIKVNTIQVDNYEEAKKKLDSGEINIIYNFPYNYDWAIYNNCWLTNSYYSGNLMAVTRKKTDIMDIKTSAVIKNGYIDYEVNKSLNYKVKYYPSVEKCVDAVLNGEVDATFINDGLADYFSTKQTYSNLDFYETDKFSKDLCFAVSQKSDFILVSIINKCINCMNAADIVSRVSYFSQANKTFTLNDFLTTYPYLSMAIGSAIALVLFGLIFFCIFNRILKGKNRELEKANMAKSDFLGRMSHEIRTPMNAIIGLSELGMNDINATVVTKDYMNKINKSGTYLLVLLNDIIDMNKIETNKVKLNYSIAKCSDVIENIINIVEPLALSRSISMKTYFPHKEGDGDVYVHLDQVRLQQIFMNLLSNAFKYSEPGSTVELSVEHEKTENGYIYVKSIITDHGCGMSKEFLKHIYEPFSQEQNSNTNVYNGVGLGLAIVKNLIDLMDASIDVKSKRGEGTIFTLLFKYKIATEEEYINQESTKNEGTVSKDIEGSRVLVVEDNDLNAIVTEAILKKADIIVEKASDGKKAVSMFENSTPNYYDAILMDLRMPIMDGFEATEKIRALPNSDAKTVPIILISAETIDSQIEKGKEVGMNDFLTKPVIPNNVYVTLSKWIKKK